MFDELAGRQSGSPKDDHEPKPTSGEIIEREENLDEALDESFPASDPPSIVSPHSGWNGRGDDEEAEESATSD